MRVRVTICAETLNQYEVRSTECGVRDPESCILNPTC